MTQDEKAKPTFTDVFQKAVKDGANLSAKAKDKLLDTPSIIKNVLDVNDDGQIDIEDIIILGMKTPGIAINREKFLRREFSKYFPENVIIDAIEHSPAHANIPPETINKIATDVIQFERNCVSGISAALSAPGGIAMVATFSADIVQYYGYMLRATQKLLYLYGFQQIDVREHEGTLDSGTMNTLILCLGVMYGVVGANNALKAMAKALAAGVNKKFMNAAVTKGVLFPIVKSVFKWFNITLTKKMCTNFFSKTIPIIGGIIGGGLTYATFKPCCDKLKSSLQDTILSNSMHESSAEESILANQIIDISVDEIIEDSETTKK